METKQNNSKVNEMKNETIEWINKHNLKDASRKEIYNSFCYAIGMGSSDAQIDYLTSLCEDFMTVYKSD